MNLKKRGITVGDILITFVIIVLSTFLIKTLNKDNKTTFYQINLEKLSYKTFK